MKTIHTKEQTNKSTNLTYKVRYSSVFDQSCLHVLGFTSPFENGDVNPNCTFTSHHVVDLSSLVR